LKKLTAKQGVISAISGLAAGAATGILPLLLMIFPGLFGCIGTAWGYGALGIASAAACGVMGNIKYESGFRPTASGDSGTSYGICQWHAGRKSRLITWCGDNGYDYKTLEGQLYYLKYELTNYYTKVHNYLKTCPNTDQGAYDAGYYFCYHFEAPASRASKSVTRGNYAKNTVWARYS